MGYRQQCVALLVTRRHPRFARHAPPPRINAKIESHLRFVGQAEGVCLASLDETQNPSEEPPCAYRTKVSSLSLLSASSPDGLPGTSCGVAATVSSAT